MIWNDCNSVSIVVMTSDEGANLGNQGVPQNLMTNLLEALMRMTR